MGLLTGVLPGELVCCPMLEILQLDHNRLSVLPAELGSLSRLRVLKADHNVLSAVPLELRQCTSLAELNLEHNKLVRPLLDFREMKQLTDLRLFGNPLEFFPEILPCTSLRYLSLANVRIESNIDLTSVVVQIESEATTSYFVASKHKLSAFFALIFRYSSCRHPLLASALAKIAEDPTNCTAIGKDEGAVRQLISMVLSESQHVVEQACLALSALAMDPTVVLRLMRADVLRAIRVLLTSTEPHILVSVLRLVANLAFSSDAMAGRICTSDTVTRLQELCAHAHGLVQKEALEALGNLGFCFENRQALVAAKGLRDLLLQLATSEGARREPREKELCSLGIARAAARALAILGKHNLLELLGDWSCAITGENEYLRKAVGGRRIGQQGVRVLCMDGGGMRGMVTVQMLRRLEAGTGRKMYEMFDLICGTSTGGMLAAALAVKSYTLDQCDDIYKTLGKVVFSEANHQMENATWREKLDQLYKSSHQNFRVVVHDKSHNAEEFERLLQEMCMEEGGDLLIKSAIKGCPKVFAVSTLVSVNPATPFVFRNYQYPPGTVETPLWPPDVPVPAAGAGGKDSSTADIPVNLQKAAFVGSCKYKLWEAIRASAAAPYYLDDFSRGKSWLLCAMRWQDGAIVANNPALIALREARLLWPDLLIDCVVSLGCGNVPTKPRGGKSGWRYLDTGQVLIESTCSIERAEEAFDTFMPMVDSFEYFRFNPVDDRCSMELDATDPLEWAKLETATSEYIVANTARFDEACSHLVRYSEGEAKDTELTGDGLPAEDESPQAEGPVLGWRRRVLLVEVPQSSLESSTARPSHVRWLEELCTREGIAFDVHRGSVDALQVVPTTPRGDDGTGTPAAAEPSDQAKAGFGSRPASPKLPPGVLESLSLPASPQLQPLAGTTAANGASPRFNTRLSESMPELLPLLSLDGVAPTPPALSLSVEQLRLRVSSEFSNGSGGDGSGAGSPAVGAPPSARGSFGSGLGVGIRLGLGPHAVKLQDRLQASAHLGVVHLALHCDGNSLIIRWQSDMLAIAEPGEAAHQFVAQALGSQADSRTGRHLDCASVAELVAQSTDIHIGCTLHKFMGRNTQEVGSYLFQRIFPSERLSPFEVWSMVGAWRDRVVVFSSPNGGLSKELIDAFLEAGARAVVAEPASGTRKHLPSYNLVGSEEPLQRDEDDVESPKWEGEGCRAAKMQENDVEEFLALFYRQLHFSGLPIPLCVKLAREQRSRTNFECFLPL
eukprot:SM000011S18999  [mRNA]  locus=s11:273180:281253:- [translate_table: standard]